MTEEKLVLPKLKTTHSLNRSPTNSARYLNDYSEHFKLISEVRFKWLKTIKCLHCVLIKF